MTTEARTQEYGRTIQCWPRGNGYEYRGDPWGPVEQRTLRSHQWNGGEREAYRAGTVEEWREIRISLRAERYSEIEILCCDSLLVSELIRNAYDLPADLSDGWQPEEIRNLYPDPDDWDLDQCREWLQDRGIGLPEPDPYAMDRQTCTELLESNGGAAFADEPLADLRAAVAEQADDLGMLEEWRDLVRDRAEAAEVYEWWRVSEWLCNALHGIGEVTIDNGYGYWWGRQCTGQGYLMDGTLQRIAEQYVQEDE